MLAGAVLLACCALPLHADTAEPPPPTVLVWGLSAEDALPAPVAEAADAELVSALRDSGAFGRVVAQADVQDVLQRTPQQTWDTCTECLLALEKLVSVDQVITGRVRRVGTMYSVELKLLDVRSAQVVASIHELSTESPEDLVRRMRSRAARLLLASTRRALDEALDGVLDPAGAR